MKLNSIEYWAMNNPVRGFIQKHYEAPRLSKLSSARPDSVLEMGCGQGVGARIIHDLYSPREYVGIDLDPKMIERARTKAADLENAVFLEGDASNLEFDDNSFDLVIEFGIVHHIPNWRDALSEVQRVLRPDGEFLFEDLSLETWERGIGKPLKKLLAHPYEQMFRRHEFLEELKTLGFATESFDEYRLGFYNFWGRGRKERHPSPTSL